MHEMDACEDNVAYDVNAIILDESQQDHLQSSIIDQSSNVPNSSDSLTKSSTNDGSEKNSAIWTTNATSTLLKLYEAKLEMLETPKKKTRIWIAISQNLKEYNIEMSPDQVRWKINALTKKYKQCIDSGQHDKFKYFKEIDNIYAHYNVDCDSYTITELLQKKKGHRNLSCNESGSCKSNPESRAMIELRKIRLANRIESDRSQGKIQLERQWLQYLHKQEEQKQWQDEIYEKNLKLREDELELRKRELELKESLEYKKIQLMEKEQENFLQIEREKYDLLKQVFYQKY